MAKVDELVVKIGADFSELKEELRKAGDATERFNDEVKKADKDFQKFDKSMKAFGGVAQKATAAMGAMATAAGVLAQRQFQAMQETRRWARQLNIAETEFQKLAAVGRRFGATTDDVGDAIKDLNERIADAASGNTTYEEALNRAGLAAKNLINLPIEQQFLKVADAIGKMNNAGDQNFITAELMADAGFRLIPMFRQGEEAIKKMTQEVVANGEALSSYDLAQLGKVDQAMRELDASVTSFGNALLNYLAPGLELSAKWMKAMSEAGKEFLGQTPSAMRDRLKEVDEALKGLNHTSQERQKLMAMGGRVGAAARSEDRKYIKLIQEKVKLENALKALDPEKATESKTTALAKQNEEQAKSNQLLKTSFDLNKAFSEQLSQTGPTLADIGSLGGGEGDMLPQMSGGLMGPEEDAAMKDLLLENLLDYQDKEWEYRNAQRERELEANRGFWDSMLAVDTKARDANLKLWESGWQGKQQVASKFLGQMATLMNTNSRKQFEIGKAAAIAQVAIDTPKAAMSAYSAMAGIPFIGPALGIAAAGAAIASGASQIQNIKSQSFGGGAAGGGGFQTASEVGGGGQGGFGRGGQDNITNVDVTLQGQSFTGEQIRGLIGAINSEVEDGAKLGAINVR